MCATHLCFQFFQQPISHVLVISTKQALPQQLHNSSTSQNFKTASPRRPWGESASFVAPKQRTSNCAPRTQSRPRTPHGQTRPTRRYSCLSSAAHSWQRRIAITWACSISNASKTARQSIAISDKLYGANSSPRECSSVNCSRT